VDCAELVRRLGLSEERITYVQPGGSSCAGDFTLHFINCDHGTGAPDAVGIVIEADGFRVFFAGDTCLRLDRREEVLQFGSLDVMLAPINGAFGNMNEQDCALLADALRPGVTIPCHYGMFASHGGSPGSFYETMKNQFPDLPMLLMAMGEEYVIGEKKQ
jgi:L-ascorbate 6-phosphate lactonase